MSLARTLRALGGNDARSVSRETFLIWMSLYPIAVALLARFGTPWIAGKVTEYVDLTLYYGPIVSFMCVLMPPGLIGLVYGFILIDDRDEGTLQALLVTPMPITVYTIARIAFPVAFGALAIMICVPIGGIAPVPMLPLIPVAVAAALWAPMSALFLVTFAENKVQGLAMFKIVNVITFAPIIALFIPDPWHYLLGIVPLYWSARAFWLLADGDNAFWISVAFALVTHGIAIAYLLGRFNRVIHR